MAPIYDTDLAEERFSKNEWSQYELWERVEQRLRRRRRLWISAACLLFVLLSSVPIVMDRLPKWKALAASRRLAQEINLIKLQASVAHAAYRIHFLGQGSLDYFVERSESCSSSVHSIERRGSLIQGADSDRFNLLSPDQGGQFGISGFVESLCYDYLAGSDAVLRNEPLVGFGIMAANDVTDKRLDRLVILLVAGPSAEISFE